MCFKPMFLKDDSNEFNKLFKKYITRYIANHINLDKVTIRINAPLLSVSIHKKSGATFNEDEEYLFMSTKQNLKDLRKAFKFFKKAKLHNYNNMINESLKGHRDLINALNNTLLHEYLYKDDIYKSTIHYNELSSMLEYIDKIYINQFFEKITHRSIKRAVAYTSQTNAFKIDEQIMMPNYRSITVLEKVAVDGFNGNKIYEGDYNRLVDYAHNRKCTQYYISPLEEDIDIKIQPKGKIYAVSCKLKNGQNLPGTVGNSFYSLKYRFKPGLMVEDYRTDLKNNLATSLTETFADINNLFFGFASRNIFTALRKQHHKQQIKWNEVYKYLEKNASETQGKLLSKLNSCDLSLLPGTLNYNLKKFVDFAEVKIQAPFLSSVKNKNIEKQKFFALVMKLYYDRVEELVSHSISDYYCNQWDFKQIKQPYSNELGKKLGQDIIYSDLKGFWFSSKDATLKYDDSLYNSNISIRQRKDYILKNESYYAFDLSLDPSMNKIFPSKNKDQLKLRMKAYYHKGMRLKTAKSYAKADLSFMKQAVGSIVDDTNKRFSTTLQSMTRIRNMRNSIAKTHMVSTSKN